ncbi:hypothetical protein IE53DRAFT_368153 [Violaceomyces palustris]|uniref:Uncharacterized protein n=1 Tax=Violaceomyces palustris TaxID=1673888 RepID=A0ACD0NZU2_9BASI|nr:hypothetical protein IE53DRAFT_368153 [Violaceomyces palustris]
MPRTIKKGAGAGETEDGLDPIRQKESLEDPKSWLEDEKEQAVWTKEHDKLLRQGAIQYLYDHKADLKFIHGLEDFRSEGAKVINNKAVSMIDGQAKRCGVTVEKGSRAPGQKSKGGIKVFKTCLLQFMYDNKSSIKDHILCHEEMKHFSANGGSAINAKLVSTIGKLETTFEVKIEKKKVTNASLPDSSPRKRRKPSP